MRDRLGINKYASDKGYKLIYSDKDMYSMYKIHDGDMIEIVHDSFEGDDKNTVFVAKEDLVKILYNL